MQRDLPQLSTRAVTAAIGVLAAITNAHALTPTERRRLETAYEAIGKYLSVHPDFKDVTIEVHPQGSLVIGTTTRPEGRIEIDIDLVIVLIQGYHNQIPCSTLLGRLHKALAAYAERHDLGVEPKRRCVQLQYAGQMHADTTPVVHHPQPLSAYGLTYALVPDRDLSRYLGTNPKGFAEWFGDAAKLMPQFTLHRDVVELTAKAEVIPLPSADLFDRLLSRIVQLFKIHRNVYFANKDFCPPSVFITTLIVDAYLAAANHVFTSPVDLILRIWQDMPRYIRRIPLPNGQEKWVLNNPTADGDNLADRINTPARQLAVYAWYKQFGADLVELITQADLPGIDTLSARVKKSYGEKSAHNISASVTDYATRERADQRIHVPSRTVAGAGLAAAPSIAMSSRPHRFFGS